MKAWYAFAIASFLAPSVLYAQDQGNPPPAPSGDATAPTVVIGAPAPTSPETAPPPPANGSPWGGPVQQNPGQPPPPQPMYVQPQPTGYAVAPLSAGELQSDARARSNRRLITGGLVVFGAVYLLTVLVGVGQMSSNLSSEVTEGWINVVPVAGPFINMGRVAFAGGSGAGPAAFVYFLDGLAQAGGVVLMIAGMVRSNTPPPPMGGRMGRVNWSVLPFAPGATAGATLTLTTF